MNFDTFFDCTCIDKGPPELPPGRLIRVVFRVFLVALEPLGASWGSRRLRKATGSEKRGIFVPCWLPTWGYTCVTGPGALAQTPNPPMGGPPLPGPPWLPFFRFFFVGVFVAFLKLQDPKTGSKNGAKMEPKCLRKASRCQQGRFLKMNESLAPAAFFSTRGPSQSA